MDIDKAKEVLNRINDAKRFDGIYTRIGIIFEAIEVVLNELDKKDKEIKELKQDIRKVMGKDRDCLTLGYYSAYVGLLDDLINIIEED